MLRNKPNGDAIAAGLPDDGIGLADQGTGAKAYGEAVGVYLAFVVDKMADRASSIVLGMRRVKACEMYLAVRLFL